MQTRGPRPTTAQQSGGLAEQRPHGLVLIFHIFFCPAVDPRAHTACKMDEGEFEFIYHFNNHFNIIPFYPFSRCMLLSVQHCHSMFIHLFTESDGEEILKRCKLFSKHTLRLKISYAK